MKIPRMPTKLGIQAVSLDEENSRRGTKKEGAGAWRKDLNPHYLEKVDSKESGYNPP